MRRKRYVHVFTEKKKDFLKQRKVLRNSAVTATKPHIFKVFSGYFTCVLKAT